MISTPQYIYLIREREFRKVDDKVYKLGKTKQDSNSRIKSYPKDSELLIQLQCDNCDSSEKELIKSFKKAFIFRSDIGAEYFEGNPKLMIKLIYETLMNVEPANSGNTLNEFRKELKGEFGVFCGKIGSNPETISMYREKKSLDSNTTKLMKSLPEDHWCLARSFTGDRNQVVIIDGEEKNNQLRSIVEAGAKLIILLE